jgi:hypothetical protein
MAHPESHYLGPIQGNLWAWLTSMIRRLVAAPRPGINLRANALHPLMGLHSDPPLEIMMI